MLTTDEKFMQEALQEAKKAADLQEVPIGAVLVYKNEIIARAHNLRETTQRATTHAELLVIEQGCEILQSWRLEHTTLYVTLEPCPMCAGAILQSRIPRVVYGTRDPKGGCVHSLYHLLNDARFNHACDVQEGVLAQEAGDLLSHFFQTLRAKRKQQKTKGNA